jgi:hypothetical protein
MTLSATTRRILAAAVVVQPLLVGVNAVFHPEIEFTAPGILAGAAAGPTTWYVVHLVAALGALMTVPAVLGLRTLIRRRGRLLGDLGVGAAIIAAVALGMAFGIEASVMRLAVTSGLEREAAISLTEAFMAAPEFAAVPVGVLAFTLAGVLMAFALIAAGVVPRWLAGVYLAGMLATLGATPGSPLGPIAFGIVTASAAFLARYVGREATGPAAPPAIAQQARPQVASA